MALIAGPTSPGVAEAMSGPDWLMLRLESPDTPMHTLKIIGLDASDRGQPVDAAELTAAITPYLPISRRLSSRVERRGRRWFWVEDEQFDISNHVQVAEVSNASEFHQLCARLAERHLPRDRPLWSVTLVNDRSGATGLAQSAVVCVHHALMDGTAAANLFDRVTTTRAGVLPALPGQHPPSADPSRAHVVRRLWRLGRAWLAMQRRTRAFGVADDVPGTILPRTILNTPSGADRVCAVRDLPLGPLRELARARSISTNGALHGTLTLALRRHLALVDRVPEFPLIANFGVAEDRSSSRCVGNRLATARVWLPVDEPDPVVALERAAASCTQSVALRRARGFEFQLRAAEFSAIVPMMRGLFVDKIPRTPVHLLTAYVTGPDEQRWLGNVAVSSWTSIAVSVSLTDVSLTAYTYNDRLHLGLVATPESLPDPDRLLAQVERALEDLHAAAHSPVDRTQDAVLDSAL